MVRSRLLQAAARTMMNHHRSSSSSAAIAIMANNHLQQFNVRGITSNASPSTTMKNYQTSSSKRFFSSEADDDDLPSILQRELEEELEGGTMSPPPELTELQTEIQSDWTIGVGEEGDATIKMYKKEATANGSKVSLVFHCQDTIPSDEEGGGLLNTGVFETASDENEEEESTAVRFTLMVSRAGKVMIMKCLSEDAEAIVEGLAVVGEEQMVMGKEGEVDEALYQGPEYTELAEDLQESITAYVQNECGVTSDVAAFIAMYADYKEQVEYVAWLKSVKSMVS
uniref:Mitochondrial glycoprotein domain-containing protein n=1 Tax=Ditylum brightwellii TaxID=49249 RepID=A0A7S2EUT0_9STRA|mmetsp:Transcript_8716/g.12999  ORF Transcript_8716/g.12999 Transcript_8716/m.12999 type:complete len:283 (+) Transcript_8716:153-1001(+)